MQSGEEAEKALKPWSEDNRSKERLLKADAKAKVETKVHEEGEDENSDQELQSNSGRDGNESDIEFPSFMNNLSTPSLPGFHTKSKLLALDNSWDNDQDLEDVSGEPDDGREDCEEQADGNDENQQGHDALVSHPDASRSP